MKTRAIILAGGEGTRLGVLTAKRTKPAVPFAGKYRIIDFPLSNCVNSNLYDVMIVAQYRPQSLIEHIGSGGPWDLNRDFTGGVSIFTPYKARASGWFTGTADAVQQNYLFVKRGNPDLVLILSGDHAYAMNYDEMIHAHLDNKADLTLATFQVPLAEASRFGIVSADPTGRVTSFVEKPAKPQSNHVNMGVYVFSEKVLSRVLWEDSQNKDSSHDFGKNIIPNLLASGGRVFAYPYTGYWVDVGTVESYWQAHMDLLNVPSQLDLYNRDWVIHTRTEERPPVRIDRGAIFEDSLICNGCVIEGGARVVRSILSPGVHVHAGATIFESIILTDSNIGEGASLEHAVLDKFVCVNNQAVVGSAAGELKIAMAGKHAQIPGGVKIQPGAMIGPDVILSDFTSDIIEAGVYLQTRRLPHEI
jgi:glucose-1-phosphate adenylyltransferase